MNHDQAVAEMQHDPSFCRVCGGWLGRKPGTKPYCTAWGCPGRTAPQSPVKAPPTAPAKTPETPAAETPAQRSRAKFADRTHDDEERARIMARAATSKNRAGGGGVPSPLSSCWEQLCSCCRQQLPPSLLVLMGCAWLYLIVLYRTNASIPLFAAGATPLQPSPLQLAGSGAVLLLATYGSCLLAGLEPLRLVKVTLAYTLMVINVVAILLLVAINHLPQHPSGPAGVELCLDFGALAVRFDRDAVVAGPCMRFDVSFVDDGGGGGAATAAGSAAE